MDGDGVALSDHFGGAVTLAREVQSLRARYVVNLKFLKRKIIIISNTNLSVKKLYRLLQFYFKVQFQGDKCALQNTEI